MDYVVGNEYLFIHAKPKTIDECKNLPPWESFFHRLKITKMRCVESSACNGGVHYRFTSPYQMLWHTTCEEGKAHLAPTIIPDDGNKSLPFDSMTDLEFFMNHLKNCIENLSILNPDEREYRLNLYNEITLNLFMLNIQMAGFGDDVEKQSA